MSHKLPVTVVVVSLVSFFNDLASDMVVPLLPLLLATVLTGGAVALGLIEGIADAVASLLKLWSGRRSDSSGGRRKGLALAGYALSNLARPLLGLVGHWFPALILRSIDRVGKGIRSAPRDALIADVTNPTERGRAFGFHRALDNAGAVGGALAAAAVLSWTSLSLSDVILWSAIPGTFGVILFAVAVREPATNIARPLGTPGAASLRWTDLSKGTRRYLLVLVLFTFARASETFIVLRGHELGMSVPHLLILWAALNLAKSVTGTWGGVLADRVGRVAVLRSSWMAYGICYWGLALVGGPMALWVVSVVYGLFAGSSEGAERAMISDFARPEERGTAFGWYYLVAGIAAIPAGLLFGLIWERYSAGAAFGYAGVLGLASALLLGRGYASEGDRSTVS
jgi:MFS family permease